uniref:Uncharacterized protein n=1 Tax=Arundo donax TaxID=35708 RepID=A0A0A9DTH0_ARUDO
MRDSAGQKIITTLGRGVQIYGLSCFLLEFVFYSTMQNGPMQVDSQKKSRKFEGEKLPHG